MAPAAPVPARTALVRRWRDWEANPVLVKELRARFRGARAFWLVSLVAVVLGSPALLMLRELADESFYHTDPAAMGRQLFQIMSVLEGAVVLLLAPAFSFAAISGERERQTLDLLLATPLSAGAIVRGKLASALAYLLLLAAAVIPVFSLAFTLGGVSWQEVLRVQLAALVGGMSLVSIGLLASACSPMTGRAAIIAYVSGGLLCLSPFLVGIVSNRIDESRLAMDVSPLFAYMALSQGNQAFGLSRYTGFLPWWAPLLTAQGLLVLTCSHLASLKLATTRRSGDRWLLGLLGLAWLVWLVVAASQRP